MAAHWCLCQPWGILSGWTPNGSYTWFCSTFKRKGPLDWVHCWVYFAINSSMSYNRFHKLEKTGFTNWKKQVCSPSTYFLKNAYFVYRKCLICLISKKLDIINIVETLSLPCTFQNTLHHKSMRCFIYLKISLEEKNKL